MDDTLGTECGQALGDLQNPGLGFTGPRPRNRMVTVPSVRWLLWLCMACACKQEEAILQALPPGVSEVSVVRDPAEGSPEGDVTVTVKARFPDIAACVAFIDAYAPTEKLARAGAAWSSETPGRESRSLHCDGANMLYVRILL